MVIEIKRIKQGNLNTNTYIIALENRCIIVDPGSGNEEDIAMIRESMKGRSLLAVLYTHNHFDHIGGGNHFDAAQYMHEKDIETVLEQRIISKVMNGEEIDVPTELIALKEEMQIGPFSFNVLHTPGHTAGSVCYVFGKQMFTGDTLFEGTHGRTDVGGNVADMRRSLLRLSGLDDDIIIYPGHGHQTVLGKEKSWILAKFGQ